MKPAPFDYIRADSADEAVALLAEYGDEARPLAGGHSLIPMMKLRLAQPKHLIDLRKVKGLTGIKADAKRFRRYGSARKLYNFHTDHADAY